MDLDLQESLAKSIIKGTGLKLKVAYLSPDSDIGLEYLYKDRMLLRLITLVISYGSITMRLLLKRKAHEKLRRNSFRSVIT